MKRTSTRRGRTIRKAAKVGPVKLFATMAAATFVLMLVLGLGSLAQSQWFNAPSSTMKGLTSGMPGDLFMHMLAMEARALPEAEREWWFSGRHLANLLVRILIDVNPMDPKSMLASELPGLSGSDPIVLRPSPADPDGLPPQEYSPRPGVKEDASAEPAPELPAFDEDMLLNWQAIVDNRHVPVPAAAPPSGGKPNPAPSGTELRKKVFIYHSHNQESFLPELEGATSPNEAFDTETNVVLLGKRLAEQLEELGVGAFNSDVNYQTAVKDYNWNLSYKYSLETVQEAFAANPDLEYFIDIHRDSQGKDITTRQFDGESYARVAFVIGQENPNWQKNDAFAAQIHERLEELYPGLSRGTWGKDGSSGHGEYNQSVSPNSILIEVGGVENTLEECYRTIEVLAQIIAEIVVDAEKVDQPQDAAKEAV